jgi:hypothetical protein
VARFADAAWRRFSELREAGRDPRAAELREVERLWHEMTKLRMRTSPLSGAMTNPLYASERPTAGWPGVPTARQALESALPALRRLHPGVLLFWLQGTDLTEQNEPETWYVKLRPSDGAGAWDYSIRLGVLHGPGHHYGTDWRGRPALFPVDELPDFVDSDLAIARAAAAGGDAYCARTGARLGGLSLERGGTGELVWRLHYTLHEPPYPLLTARVDALTGEVTSVEEEDRPRQYRIERPEPSRRPSRGPAR